MNIEKGTNASDSKEVSDKIFQKIQGKYPEARAYKFSIREDSHSYFTTTIEVQVGKKKLIAKKIGESANQSINRAYSALRKRLEKALQRRKSFFSVSSSFAC